MRYDFSKMDADSFELMIRSLNEKIFGVKCEQYGLGPDGQREFTFEGKITDSSGIVYEGRTIGQVKYKYITSKEDDYTWLTKVIAGELKRFSKKDIDYIPDNYIFYTNIVLTPTKDTGTKDKINAYVKANNNIIKNFYVRGYDEICALLDNNRDVATSYASLILPGDVLMKTLLGNEPRLNELMKKYLSREFEEEMHTRLEQAGSVTEKKISIEKVCVDIGIIDRELGQTKKFAEHIFTLGNKILGYKKLDAENVLDKNENFVLIGGPGQGKSTICQFIAQIYRAYKLQLLGYKNQEIDRFVDEIKKSYKYRIDRIRIPFKIVLREYAAWINRKNRDDNVSVMQYIMERIRKMEGNTLSIDTLRKMIGEEAWIFFFDGLDEVPESSNREEVLKQIHIFITMELKEVHCDCIIIGTTRAQGYNNDFDETKYKHIEVAELSKEDCYKYVEKLFEVMEEQTERREEYIHIMKEALEDETTSRLMKTPLQATIISILVKSGGKPPHERYSLFRQYYDTMVRREKQKGIVATLNDNTDWLEEIHLLIGHRLQLESERKKNPSAEISREELETLLRNYVEQNRDDFYDQECVVEEKKELFLLTITQRICFLCENREGFYSFYIRSIQEYFAGTYLVKGRSDKDAIYNINQIAYSSYWRNVLLFSLGYIELERKSLESEIGILCEQMNGKNNIVSTDYTSENLCLFGSWLALDILAEDIFRGRQQDKYITLAANAMELVECAYFNRFNLITGTQKEKLIRYVKENYYKNAEKHQNALWLFLKLDENEKNNLTCEIKKEIERFSEEQQLAIYIDILKAGIGYSNKVVEMASERLVKALEKGKLKQFLPKQVLYKLLDLYKEKQNVELKRSLFLQCLYHDSFNINEGRMLNALGIQGDAQNFYKYLTTWRSGAYNHAVRVKLTESYEIVLLDRVIDKEEVKKVQIELKKMNLNYLVELCEFLLAPTLVKFQNLYSKLDKEEKYLRKKYSLVLKHYVPYEKIVTEEDFQQAVLDREADYEKFINSDWENLYYCETNVVFSGVVNCNDYALDELIDTGKLSIEKIGKLSEKFFEKFFFIARVQAECTTQVVAINGNTAERFILILSEAARRKFYYGGMYMMFALLIASEYKSKLWQQIPNYTLVDQMIQTEFSKESVQLYELECIGTEELESIIKAIVVKLIYEAKENNYLSIIPFIVTERIDLKRCISKTDIRELEKIEYSVATNVFSVKLLRMCIEDNENPKDLIEDILKCKLKHRIIFWGLERVLHYCKVENKENLLVEAYLSLTNEKFEGSQQISNRMLEDMMEVKCNATVGIH